MKQLYININLLLSKHEKKQLHLLIVKEVVITVIDILSLAILLLVVNFFVNTQPIPTKWIDREWLQRNIYIFISIFLAFYCLKNFLGYRLHVSNFNFVYNVATRLSQENILHYLRGSYLDHISVDTSVHMRKISQQPVEFAHYVLASLQQIITQSILIAVTVTAILLYNAALFLLLLVILLPPAMAIIYIIRKKTKLARINTKTSGERSLQYLKEALNGYVESAIYDKSFFFAKRYTRRQKELNNYLANLQSIQGMPSRLIELFAIAGLFALIAINKYSGNALSFISIGAFMAAAYKIMPGLVKVTNSLTQVKAYEFTVNDLLAEKNKNIEISQNIDLPILSSIVFRDIHFSYKEKKVLENFNCKIQAGDIIGVTGISGSGKTTFVNLLLGFLKQVTGEIFINDHVADELIRKQYGQQIAFVKQQGFFIYDSIEKNITLDEAGSDAKKLATALTLSGLYRLIETYPEGVKKMITENGKNISGGQRQRISMARALYKDANMLILDEPFSELDKASELSLLQTCKELSLKGKIIILITHNKDSLSFCNKTISFDEQ